MVTLRGLGTTVEVDLSESGLDESEFLRLWSRARNGAGTAEVSPPTGSNGSGAPLRLVGPVTMETATQRITRALIDKRRGQLLMLHAGAVAHPTTGRSLAYVAPSGTGKSTLSKRLALEYGYLTDETVAIDPLTLQIHPYQKPITWADVPGKPKRELCPDDLGLLPAPATAHLVALAVLRRTPGERASFTKLGLFDAMELLVPETSSLPALERPLHTLRDVIDRVGGVTLIEFGESHDLVDWCRNMLETGA